MTFSIFTAQEVQAMLELLPPVTREIVRLRYGIEREVHSWADVARVLSLKMGEPWSRQRLHYRARQQRQFLCDPATWTDKKHYAELVSEDRP